MSWHRIYAIILRHWYNMRRNLDRMTDLFYWPLVELLLWGLGSSYLTSFIGDNGSPATFVVAILAGICLWVIVNQTQLSVSVGLLDDMWNRNMVNIFGSPLRFSEWLIATLIVAGARMLLSVGFITVVALFLYHVNVYAAGIYLVPFVVLLLLTGWTIGFFVSGIIVRLGSRVQALAWTLGVVIVPFSAVYYPLSVLPPFAQTIAAFIPTSYVFEGMRQAVETHTVDPSKIFISLGLNLVYMSLALWFLYRGFRRAMAKGLVKLF